MDDDVVAKRQKSSERKRGKIATRALEKMEETGETKSAFKYFKELVRGAREARVSDRVRAASRKC